MKKIIFLACMAILSIAPMNLVCGKQPSIDSQHDGIYVIAVRNGIVNVLSDEVSIMPLPNDELSLENIASLKEAWKQCYGAMLLNEQGKLNSFFTAGLPNVLQTLDKNDGQVRIFTTSRVKNTIRVILKFEVMQSSNSLNVIYDAHIWSMNNHGKWEVKSTVYQ